MTLKDKVELFLAAKILEKASGLDGHDLSNDSLHKVNLNLSVRGLLLKGPATWRKPTSRALTKTTLALLIRRLGIQRETALQVLLEVLCMASMYNKDAERLLLEEYPEVEQAFKLMDEWLESFPKIKVDGCLHVEQAHVEKVRR